MKKINKYIIEKLHINKDTKIKSNKTDFRKGDPIIRISISHECQFNNTELVVNLWRGDTKPVLLYFNKFDDNDRIKFNRSDIEERVDSFEYEKNKFINSGGYYEYHTDESESNIWFCYSIYLDLNSGIEFIKKLIDNDGRCAYLYPFFDKKDDLNIGIKLKNPLKQVKAIYDELIKIKKD